MIAVANQRLIHDVAFATSRHILEVFAGCIREEVHREAFAEIYERVKAGIESFELHSNRMESRLRPGRN
jgi:hypothetical protein